MFHSRWTVLIAVSVFLAFGLLAIPEFQAQSRIDLIGKDDVAKKAKETFDQLDYWDEVALDQFIRIYPTSKESEQAFSLRYAMLRDNPSIEGYNDFIERYPDRAATISAIQEVYTLYQEEDRVSGYLDFIRRYPNTPQAVVAKLHMQSILFDLVRMLNQIEDYDSYLETFPDAPQAPMVRELALDKVVTDENALKAKNRQAMGPDQYDKWETRHLSQLISDWYGLIDSAEAGVPNSAEAAGYLHRAEVMDRHEKMIRRCYGANPLSLKVPEEKRWQKLFGHLTALRTTIDKNHRELLDKLEEEGEKTRRELRNGFAQLASDNQQIRELLGKNILTLQQGFSVLHDDLVKIDDSVRKTAESITDLRKSVVQLSQVAATGLANLDEDLVVINRNINHLHQDMNKGFAVETQEVRELRNDVRTGFRIQADLGVRQLNLSNAILNTSLEMNQNLVRLDYNTQAGLRELGNTVSAGFDRQAMLQIRQLNATEYMTSRVDQGFQRLANIGEAQLSVGQAQLEVSRANLSVSHLISQTQLRTLYSVNTGFARQLVATNNLASGIDLVGKKIDLVRDEVKVVGGKIDVGNAHLEVLGDKLDVIGGYIEEGNRKFDIVDAKVDNANHQIEVVGTQLADQDHHLLRMETQIGRGFQSLDTTMHSGFQRVETATWRAASDIKRNNEQMLSRIQQTQEKTNGGGLLGKIFGIAGSFIPYVGPLVAPLAAKVGEAIEGGASSSRTVSNAATVLQKARLEGGKSRMIGAAAGIAGAKGVSRQSVGDILKSQSEDTLRKLADPVSKEIGVPKEVLEFAINKIF